MNRRVVVTGLGTISPIGIGVEAFWSSLLEGKNGISRISGFDTTGYRSQIAAEIRDFDIYDWRNDKILLKTDRFTHFAVVAADMAIADAGLHPGEFDPDRAGTIIGSGIGGSRTIENGAIVLYEKGAKSISPFFISALLVNTAASVVAMFNNLQGPHSALSVACSTGSQAIGEAYQLIQNGKAEVMVAGSAEACITPLAFAGFCSTRSLSCRNDAPEKASRPFDKMRDGFVMGEGAGIVVMEELDHATARGAQPHAEVVGYGSTSDAYHLTAPDPEGSGMYRVMKEALKSAGLEAEDVEYINAHGTSTVLNDRTESQAILKVFGEHASNLKVSSNKSMIGHLMAAAGAVEFIATVMSVSTGHIPPTINYEEPDPECPLDYVVSGTEVTDPEVALSNSFGFGGGNACLAVRKYIS